MRTLQDISELEEAIPTTVPTSPTDDLHYSQSPQDPIPYHKVITTKMIPIYHPIYRYGRKFGAPIQPQWNEIFKVLHNDAFPHLMPIQAPNKLGTITV